MSAVKSVVGLLLLKEIQTRLIFQTAAIQMRTDPRTVNFASVLTFMLMCLI